MDKTYTDYREVFAKLGASMGAHFDLDSDLLVVQKLPDYELKSSSGLIMHTPKDHVRGSIAEKAPQFVQVVYVGPGYYNEETKEDVPLETKPGDVLLVGTASVNWFSKFGPVVGYESETLGITREREMLIRFRSFDEVFKLLNKLIREKV